MPYLPLNPRTDSVAADPRPDGSDALVLEAWAQGYMVGSLIIMAFITTANMRRGVLLHKLILIELILGVCQGFWLFFSSAPGRRVDKWWLSAAAIPLNTSWVLHNIISCYKIRPFLSSFWNKVIFWSVIASIPYWVVEVYANFAYFHYGNPIFKRTRPFELLFRDPWWIITTVHLFVVIKTQYNLKLIDIIRISPRFGIMLFAMLVSIVFVVCDVLSVTKAIKLAGDTGINPFWKMAMVFKCLTDSVILDDFKTALDRLCAFKISRLDSLENDHGQTRRTFSGAGALQSWDIEGGKASRTHREGHREGDRKVHVDEIPISPSLQKSSGHTTPIYDSPRIIQKETVISVKNHDRHSQFSVLERNRGDIVPTTIDPVGVSPITHAYQPQTAQSHWNEGFEMNAVRDWAVDDRAVRPNASDTSKDPEQDSGTRS